MTLDPSYQQAKPILDAIAYLIAGGGSDGDRALGRLVLGLAGRPKRFRLGRGDRPVSAASAARPGIDLIEIERLERALERHPRLARRLFSPGELELRAAIGAAPRVTSRPGSPPRRRP